MFISFVVTLRITPWLIRYTKKIGLVVKDLNKKKEPLIPLSGGLAVLGGIFTSVMAIIFIQIFVYDSTSDLIFLLAAISSVSFITLVGFIDDLLIRKNKESSSGLKQWQKPLLTLIAAIPLMAVNAGTREVGLPFFGTVNFGLLYPLLLIPIGVMGAANMVNMLEGYNGMGSGMGIVYTGALGLYAYVHGRQVAAVIALATLGALIAFYRYNKYPAKILPGDSLTYLLGGVIACIAILGNLEKAALIMAVPFFVEFVLKARSRFKAQSYGYYKDGKIHSRYKGIYSIPHFFARTGRFTEKQITSFMILIMLIFAILIWFV